METNKTEGSPNIKDVVLAEYQKGNIVVAGVDGLQVMNLKEFIKQPAAGMLYDLNRNEMVVLTFIDDPKWVNDYAVCKTIQALKAELESITSIVDEPKKEEPKEKSSERLMGMQDVMKTIDEWLKSDDVFVTDRSGNRVDGLVGCESGSLMKRLIKIIKSNPSSQ